MKAVSKVKKGLDCSIFILILSVGLFIWTTATASESTINDGILFEEKVVQEGDSLWSIASEQTKHIDAPIQNVVLWMKEHNELSGSHIYPGQKITVPLQLEAYVTE
ncbi:cell division suppressor protein YneA [Evansella halocellulosilytica]|uniref:cell division suppressor protein YneA n=1 Tax=Evansella halocellulosilytica TaxID=2011013 RepID=UPI0015C6AA77|nr:LysM peptidoglycan-binding domain-containing protein [Evansella halocellulosilytica]